MLPVRNWSNKHEQKRTNMKLAVYYHLNFGGAKRVVYEQVKGLVQMGHTVDVYSVNSQDDVFSPKPIASSFHNEILNRGNEGIPFVGRLFTAFNTFFLLRELNKRIARQIDRKKYDFVIVHPDRLIQAPYLLRFLKTKSIYYCQEPLRIAYEYSMRLSQEISLVKRFYESIIRKMMQYEDRINVRSASYTIASCYHIRERMIEVYDVMPKVIYPGIDEKVFKPQKNLVKKNQILFVGSTTDQIDGFKYLKRALTFIPKKIRPNLHVLSFKNNNNERLSDGEVVALYNSSLLVACMVRLETFGLAPLEGMATGIPVIATNISGHRETIVNNVSGFLVDLDSKEIAEKITYLLRHKSIHNEMGRKGRGIILKHWTWNKRNLELEKYLKTLKKKRND